MRRQHVRSCLVALAAAPFAGGCLAMGGGEKTVFDESARYPVRFENQNASRAFYEGLEHANRGAFTDGGGWFVLFIAGGGGSTFHETQFYNAQVRRADIDRDGVITEEEALGYREVMTAKDE